MLHGKPREGAAGDFSLEKYVEAIRLLEKGKVIPKMGLLARMLFSIRKATNAEVINMIKYGKFRSPCTAVRRIIVIDEVGNVYPCETISENIGNLRECDYDIKKIICSEKRYALEEKYKIRSECNCNWECAIFSNIIYDFKRMPSLLWSFFFK